MAAASYRVSRRASPVRAQRRRSSAPLLQEDGLEAGERGGNLGWEVTEVERSQ
jgi:hypothetical protein